MGDPAASPPDAGSDRLRLPPPLFWQTAVLALASGVLASRFPVPGAACGLIVLAGWGLSAPARFALLVLSFALGSFSGIADRPHPPSDIPAWFRPAAWQRVTGAIVDVSGQPDRRLRIILENVKPDENAAAPPLPGRVSLSWDQGARPDTPRPLPGQRMTLTASIRPMTGYANAGTSDMTAWWAARGVWFSAWTSSRLAPDRSAIRIDGDPSPSAALRERLRVAMVDALGGSARGSDGFRPPDDAPILPVSTPDSQARAMLPALLFGDRYGLDTETLDLFTRAGLVHSLALSGQHLALAGTAAALLVWLLSMSRATVFLRAPRRALLLAVGAPLAALYLWMGNAPLSLIRAALMMLFGLLLFLGGRPSTLYDLLMLAALCFLAAWPSSLFDLSVQLSVLSVAGIALALPVLSAIRKIPGRSLPARAGRGALVLLATSLAVQAPTLPIVIHTFGRVTPLFPLNLLWLPVLEVVVMPLAALGLLLMTCFGPQAGSDALFHLASLPARGMILLLEGLRDRHWLMVWQTLRPSGLSAAGFAAAVAGAAAMMTGSRDARTKVPRAAKRLLICAALLLPLGSLEREADAWMTAREERVTLRMLDVGQGQALVVEWPGGRLLLDGGGSTSPRFDPGRDIVAHALTANRPPRLDMVVASHADLDHARGLRAILETFDVGFFGRSALPFGNKPGSDGRQLEDERRIRNIPLREWRAGDSLDLGNGLALEVIHPPDQGRFSSNNGSLAIRLSRNGHGLALLCGDAQLPALKRILRTGADISAEVLVVPHHGSSTGLLPEFYRAVSPRLALISCGVFNSFGFPHAPVLRALADEGIPVLTTADCGEIRVTWNKDGERRLDRARVPAGREKTDLSAVFFR